MPVHRFSAPTLCWLWCVGTPTCLASAQALVFGYTPDAAPVSSAEIIQGNKTGKILGFCGALYDRLAQDGFGLIAWELPFDERFEVFAKRLEGRAGVQCGPSSDTPRRRAALQGPATAGFSGRVTRPFLITGTKLLIRTDRIAALDERPEALRIGLLKPRPGMVPATTEVIEAVIPSARFVGLANRTAAVERLLLEPDRSQAIDAYASDEIMLRDMLAHDIPAGRRADYRIAPPFYAYSREAYVLVVYNAPQLTGKLDAWLDSAPGRAAVRALDPPSYGVTDLFRGMARGDRLALMEQWLPRLATLAALALLAALLGLWRRRRTRRRSAPQPEILPERTLASEPTVCERILTAREREILVLLAQGRSNKEAARALDLSPRTVEAHRKNIYTKLGINTTAALVEYALRQGYV
jgi:DNA-binding CsgD family transcriptional regulator